MVDRSLAGLQRPHQSDRLRHVTRERYVGFVRGARHRRIALRRYLEYLQQIVAGFDPLVHRTLGRRSPHAPSAPANATGRAHWSPHW